MTQNNNWLYNVTVKVELDIAEDWKTWMIETHIPDVMKSNCFLSVKLNRLLYLDETDGITFAVQYVVPNKATFEKYQNEYAKALQDDHKKRYGDKALAFRTLMEIIHKA